MDHHSQKKNSKKKDCFILTEYLLNKKEFILEVELKLDVEI